MIIQVTEFCSLPVLQDRGSAADDGSFRPSIVSVPSRAHVVLIILSEQMLCHSDIIIMLFLGSISTAIPVVYWLDRPDPSKAEGRGRGRRPVRDGQRGNRERRDPTTECVVGCVGFGACHVIPDARILLWYPRPSDSGVFRCIPQERVGMVVVTQALTFARTQLVRARASIPRRIMQ